MLSVSTGMINVGFSSDSIGVSMGINKFKNVDHEVVCISPAILNVSCLSFSGGMRATVA